MMHSKIDSITMKFQADGDDVGEESSKKVL